MRAAAARQASEADETARQEFKSIAEQFLATGGKHKKNAPGWKRRTAAEYKRVIDKRFVPRWKGRTIHSITRDEIADFLVELAETAPVAANRALATLSALMNWYQRQRGSGFTSPIVRGMAPTEENARARVLSDDEIRLVWRAAGRCGTFGAIVKVLLLTGARRSEVAAMCHSQIDAEGVWGLSGEHVKNSLPLYLPLSQDTLAIIGKQAKIDKQELVFSISGAHKFQSWSRGKASLDKRIAWQLRAQQRALSQNRTVVIPEWHLHDLRRTARSLMSRAKVAPEHAERVLNHKIRGVQGTYDRHNYEDEKRDALERLACLLRQIVEGQGAKLVQFPMRSAAA
jgi:integrase